MEELKKELKLMQTNPRFYLATYFDDLKREVDLEFALKLDKQDKYLEIISKIESFQQDCFEKIKPFNTFDQEIEALDPQSSIYDLKYKIESKLFLDNSIMFFKNYSSSKKSFLLIIKKAYLRKSSFDLSIELEYLNREILIAYLLKQHLYTNLNNITNVHVFYLDINLLSMIDIFQKKIKQIDPFTFLGLIGLEKIKLTENKIEQLNESNLFNGLNGLKEINFRSNQIIEIHPAIFNGLTNLIEISFWKNEIKQLDQFIFSGLTSLEEMSFSCNCLQELGAHLFQSLRSLRKIKFFSNHIQKIHSSAFNGCISLQDINLASNQIQELDSSTFNGLISLKKIDFSNNQITKIHSSTFSGLNNLEIILFSYN